MKRFDDYYNACMSDLLGEDNTSNVPNPEDFNAETSVDVADKLAEELKEHFGEDVKEVQIPSTLSNQIKAFLWTNDALKISIQISVLKSRIDNDYKITIQDLSKEDSKVIDIPDDQVETQIMDVIEKLDLRVMKMILPCLSLTLKIIILLIQPIHKILNNRHNQEAVEHQMNSVKD